MGEVEEMLKPEYFVNGVIMVMALFTMGNTIFNERKKVFKLKTTINLIIAIVITILVNIYNETLISNTLRVMALFLMFIYFYKFEYKKSISITIMASFITYLIYFLSEIIIDIPLYIILSIIKI